MCVGVYVCVHLYVCVCVKGWNNAVQLSSLYYKEDQLVFK